ncbi:hypothetical protein [Mesonia sp.]|uniref:hypothetical protein n=1 Tax=Mesonia sp. TaxID=1960830 RepID=UPI003F9B36A4
MKKLMMTAAVVAMFFATANTNAQTEKVQKTPEKVHETVQDGFQEIEANKLPDAVKKAIVKDFRGADVEKAYINKKREFKLVLKAEGAEAKTVYANADGEWIKPTA